MAMEIEGPDGGVVEFPDGTPDFVIKRAMAQAYAASKAGGTPAVTPVSTAPSSSSDRDPVASRAQSLLEPKRTGAFASPMIAPEARGVTPTGDAVKSFGSGVVKGSIALGTLPGNLETLGRAGINWAGRKMGATENAVNPEPVLPNYPAAKWAVEEATGKKLYAPQTTAGQYAGAVGEFTPNLVFPGSIAQRVLGNVVAPALTSEAAGQVTEGTSAEPYARVGGALLGPAAVNAGAKAVTPFATAPERAKQVAVLEGQGVKDLTAGQKTGSMPLRWAESAALDVPFSGTAGASRMERQAEQFTQAALKTAGINAPRATQEVINDAFTTLGTKFDVMAAKSSVRFDPPLARKITAVSDQYNRYVPEAMRSPVIRELSDEVTALGRLGQTFSGDRYQAWRSEIERAARGAGGNTYLKDALRDVKTVLDDAVEKGLSKIDQGQWQQTRREYKNLIAVAKAREAAGEASALGLISPAALRNAVKGQNARSYVRGKGDMAELANAGNAIMKPLPQSGTTPRAIASNIGKVVLGSAAGGAAVGGPEGAAGGALAPFVLQALLSRGLNSKPAQRYLGNRRIPQPPVNKSLGLLAGVPQAAKIATDLP